MAKLWRVSIEQTSVIEAETEAQAVRQFLDAVEPDDCEVELESDSDDEEDEEEEDEEDETVER